MKFNLITIAGPEGSGKSKLAKAIAKQYKKAQFIVFNDLLNGGIVVDPGADLIVIDQSPRSFMKAALTAESEVIPRMRGRVKERELDILLIHQM